MTWAAEHLALMRYKIVEGAGEATAPGTSLGHTAQRLPKGTLRRDALILIAALKYCDDFSLPPLHAQYSCVHEGGGKAFEAQEEMSRRVEGLMMLYGAIVQVGREEAGLDRWKEVLVSAKLFNHQPPAGRGARPPPRPRPWVAVALPRRQRALR